MDAENVRSNETTESEIVGVNDAVTLVDME
jgi:hypothetical protein